MALAADLASGLVVLATGHRGLLHHSGNSSSDTQRHVNCRPHQRWDVAVKGHPAISSSIQCSYQRSQLQAR